MNQIEEIIRKAEIAFFYGVPPPPPPKWMTAECCGADSHWFTVVEDDRSVTINCGDSCIWDAKFCPCCGKPFVIVPFVAA